MFAIVFLGLIGNITTLAEIQRWAEIHYPELKTFLRFRRFKRKSKSQKKPKKIPHAISIARVLRKLSLADLQKAFAEFLNVILKDTEITASVDGKAAKQMKDANGKPILMLNVFTHTLKVHLASWSVKGEKTIKEIRERCAAKPMEPALKIGYRKKLVSGLCTCPAGAILHIGKNPVQYACTNRNTALTPFRAIELVPHLS